MFIHSCVCYDEGAPGDFGAHNITCGSNPLFNTFVLIDGKKVVDIVSTFSRMSFLSVDSKKNCSFCKLGLDFLQPGQVRHKGGSGARAEVDHQWNGILRNTEQSNIASLSVKNRIRSITI